MSREDLLKRKELLLRRKALLQRKAELQAEAVPMSSQEAPKKGVLAKLEQFDDHIQQPILKGMSYLGSGGQAPQDMDQDGRISGREAIDKNILIRGQEKVVDVASGLLDRVGLEGASDVVENIGDKFIGAEKAVAGFAADILTPGTVDVATLGAGKVLKAGKAIAGGAKSLHKVATDKNISKVAQFLAKDVNEFERAADAIAEGSSISGNTKLFTDAQILIDKGIFNNTLTSKSMMKKVRKVEGDAVAKASKIINDVPEDIGFSLDSAKLMTDLEDVGIGVDSVDDLIKLVGNVGLNKASLVKLIDGEHLSVKQAQRSKQLIYKKLKNSYNVSNLQDNDTIAALKVLSSTLKTGIEKSVPDAKELIEANATLSAIISSSPKLNKIRKSEETGANILKDLNPLKIAERAVEKVVTPTARMTTGMSTGLSKGLIDPSISKGDVLASYGTGMAGRLAQKASGIAAFMQNPVVANRYGEDPTAFDNTSGFMAQNFKQTERSFDGVSGLLKSPIGSFIKENLAPELVMDVIPKVEAGVSIPSDSKSLLVKGIVAVFPEFFEHSEYNSLVDNKLTDPHEIAQEMKRISKDSDLTNIQKAKRAKALNRDGTLIRTGTTNKGDLAPVMPEEAAMMQNFFKTRG